MTADTRHLWLQTGDGAAVDVNAPERTVTVGDPLRPPAAVAGSVLVAALAGAGQPTLQRLRDGTLLVHPDLAWSLVDPLAPRAVVDPSTPTPSARAHAERWWRRLAWWGAQDPALRETCARVLDIGLAGGGDLVRVCDRLAASGNPFGGWEDTAPADPACSREMRPLPAPEEAAAIGAWLADPAGLGALYGGHYTPREGQGDLATAVAEALSAGTPLVAEAGTGVGKTLGYLVPLLARLAAADGRAVVSTHTRALQTQILEHDLPRLAPLVGDLKPRLLMGRHNYLCRRQRVERLSRPVTDLRDAARAVALRVWLAATSEGARDELTSHPLLADEVPALFDVAQPCSPSLCYENDGCFVTRARRLARTSRLLVVNHALLVTDLAADRTVIGPYDWLVVDEAHRLPPVALETLAIRCDRQRRATIVELVGEGRGAERLPEVPELLAGRLRTMGDAATEMAAAACEDFARAVAHALQRFDTWWTELADHVAQGTGPVESGGRLRVRDREVAFAPLRDCTGALREAAAFAATCGAVVAQRVEPLGDLPDTVTSLLLSVSQAAQVFAQLEHDVRFLTEEREDAWVTWLESSHRAGLRTLGATPLAAGPHLRGFWEATGLAPVATSATLAVGEDFGFMLRELGLDGRRPATATQVVPSPFDFARQSLFLALETMPAPDAPGYAAAVAEVLLALRRAVRRQTLVLFTSYRLLDAVGAQVQTTAALEGGLGEIILQTGSGGTGELLARFRRGAGAMLLGVSTFWEGVDFPGEALEVLVVTKLPFLVPSDPWVEARCEQLQATGENAFTSFMVRDAVLRLRQGVGRLLRRDTDRGVVILLDNRLHTKSYGTTFLSALPQRPWYAPDAAALAERVAGFWRNRGEHF